MAERDRIYRGKLKQKGIFIFKDFYEFLFDYLMDENYDVFEDKYTERVDGDTKQIEIKWTAIKEVTDYFRYEITFYWIVQNLKKVKVKREGKEVTMDSGSIEIKFDAILQKDYENRWENNAFLKFLRGIYDRYIIRSRVDDNEFKLFQEASEFTAQAKSFLALEGKHSTP